MSSNLSKKPFFDVYKNCSDSTYANKPTGIIMKNPLDNHNNLSKIEHLELRTMNNKKDKSTSKFDDSIQNNPANYIMDVKIADPGKIIPTTTTTITTPLTASTLANQSTLKKINTMSPQTIERKNRIARSTSINPIPKSPIALKKNNIVNPIYNLEKSMTDRYGYDSINSSNLYSFDLNNQTTELKKIEKPPSRSILSPKTIFPKHHYLTTISTTNSSSNIHFQFHSHNLHDKLSSPPPQSSSLQQQSQLNNSLLMNSSLLTNKKIFDTTPTTTTTTTTSKAIPMMTKAITTTMTGMMTSSTIMTNNNQQDAYNIPKLHFQSVQNKPNYGKQCSDYGLLGLDEKNSLSEREIGMNRIILNNLYYNKSCVETVKQQVQQQQEKNVNVVNEDNNVYLDKQSLDSKINSPDDSTFKKSCSLQNTSFSDGTSYKRKDGKSEENSEIIIQSTIKLSSLTSNTSSSKGSLSLYKLPILQSTSTNTSTNPNSNTNTNNNTNNNTKTDSKDFLDKVLNQNNTLKLYQKIDKVLNSVNSSINISNQNKRTRCDCEVNKGNQYGTCNKAKSWLKLNNYNESEFEYLKYTYQKLLNTKNPDNQSIIQIQKDIHRTFPNNPYFSNPNQGLKSLERVLIAFANYEPQIGYAQGMNFIAGSLLYHAEEYIAFWLLAMIFEKFEMRDIYLPKLPGLSKHCQMIDILMVNYISDLYTHLCKHNITVEMFCSEWILGLFSSVIPVEIMGIFYDNMLVQGWPYFYKLILAYLMQFKKTILAQTDFSCIMTILKNQNQNNKHKLFKNACIDWNELFNKALKLEIDDNFIYKMHSHYDLDKQIFKVPL